METAGNSQSSRSRLNIVQCKEGPWHIPFLNNKGSRHMQIKRNLRWEIARALIIRPIWKYKMDEHECNLNLAFNVQDNRSKVHYIPFKAWWFKVVPMSNKENPHPSHRSHSLKPGLILYWAVTNCHYCTDKLEFCNVYPWTESNRSLYRHCIVI